MRVRSEDLDIESVSLRQLTCHVMNGLTVCNTTYRITDGELEIVE